MSARLLTTTRAAACIGPVSDERKIGQTTEPIGGDNLKGRKIYRFEYMRTRSEDCRNIIREQWEKGAAAVELHGIREKCKSVGRALSHWNWASFGHVQRRIKVLRENLASIQAAVPSAGSQDMKERLNRSGAE
ncbi:hypothetical protein U1Q18_038769 [Sarracenia purpurea var. burkii]